MNQKQKQNQFHKQFVAMFFVGLLSTLQVAGCGAPNILSMRPTVTKLAAEVILVNQPPQWNAQDLQNAASQAGVNTVVVHTTSASVAPEVIRVMKNQHIGFCMVVSSGPLPMGLSNDVIQRSGLKFDFVTDGSDLPSGTNVRNVFLARSQVNFMVGYAATVSAQSSGQATIGWLTGGNVQATKHEIQSTFSGIYAANPNSSIIPVIVDTTGIALPHIIIASRPLTSAEQLAVVQSGSLVYSLVSVPKVGPYAVAPTFVAESDVLQEFSVFATSAWKAGNLAVSRSSFITVNPLFVMPTVLQTITAEASAVSQNSNLVDSTWETVPGSSKLLWDSIVNTGL